MFAKELKKSLKTRFPNMWKIDLYLSAMIVDPRFKTTILGEEEKVLALINLKAKVKQLATPVAVTTEETGAVLPKETPGLCNFNFL